MISKRLAECQRVIGYHFTDEHQLEIALTHSSVRTPDRECNERLEFLGDSVLGLAITDELYKRLPDQAEGELTRIKSAVVSRGALYRASTRMGLVRFIEVAKGVGRREELPVSLTANLVESIIGAIYVDAGFFPAREFILRHLGPELEDVLNDRVAKNYKSLLQHEAQERMGVTPVYRTIEAEGPDHRRNFTVAAILRGTEYGRASGINKKEAEQEAARHAIESLQRSGRGRRRRSDGRGEGPREGREPHERDPARESGVAPARAPDDDDWKRWAESGPPAASPAVAGGGVPQSRAGATPYPIGPEADDGWSEGPATAPDRVAASPIDAVASAPAPADVASFLTPSAAGAPPPSPAEAAGGSSPDVEPRGRRRRRGTRGRSAALDDGVLGPSTADTSPAGPSTSGEAPPNAAQSRPPGAGSGGRRTRATASTGTPAALPRDALLAEVFSDSALGSPREPPPDTGPSKTAPPDAAASKPDAPPRRRTTRGQAKSPADDGPARKSKSPSPAPARDFEFGKGVEPIAPAVLPAPARAVTDVGSVRASKPAPVVQKPTPKGGFGDGL